MPPHLELTVHRTSSQGEAFTSPSNLKSIGAGMYTSRSVFLLGRAGGEVREFVNFVGQAIQFLA